MTPLHRTSSCALAIAPRARAAASLAPRATATAPAVS
jgi:hypothetical protein